MPLFEELKRRNVFRVAIAYLIAAWLVLQVSELVLEAIEAPAWVLKVFLLIFALGFPIAMLFSWAYELTPEGIKREKEVDRNQSVTHNTGRKLNQITIAMVIALIALVAVDRMTAPDSAGPATDVPAVTTGANTDDKSIAVLAFEDLSPQSDQEYFADGLSEELLNVLAQTPGLQVAGRTSSFAFKGQNRDLREIGEILNVAHILEGSVRKSGNKIRVTAQLINAQTGFHLYSQTYDRDLTDVFAVQDEISASISNALRTELIGTQTNQVAETSIEAYDLYLVARQKIYTRNKDEMTEASRLLDEAIAIDSEYAPALAQKALVLQLLSDNVGSYGDIPIAESYALSRPLIDKALSLDPNLAEAHAVLGLIMDADPDASVPMQIASLEHALELNPNMDNARNWLSTAYGRAGKRAQGRALLESVVERDPLFGPAFNNLIQDYIRAEDYDLANALIGRVERIVGETGDIHQAWGAVAFTQGEKAQAIRHLRKVYDENPSDTVGLLWYGWSLEDLGEYETLADIGLPIGKIFALDALGRFDEAQETLDVLSPVDNNAAVLSAAARHFMTSRNCAGIVTYIEEYFDDLDTALLRLKRPDGANSGHLAPLAYCYLQIGDEQQFAKLINALKESMQERAAYGSTFVPTLYQAAELAALTGQEDEVISLARKIVDKNAVGVDFFGDPIFDRFKDHAEFQNLNATLLQRANDERAKLGLEPYQAPIASN
ncbi:MAG: adenylyl cyclase [Gammaproteobacteria bacterium]|jgi:TolB-like protein|nr:adenylyl cyclase [Gammaproteobacteria bacterium]